MNSAQRPNSSSPNMIGPQIEFNFNKNEAEIYNLDTMKNKLFNLPT